MESEIQTYNLGDFSLQRGGVIKNAFIAYKTFGDPKNPLIIYPTWYSGDIAANEWLIGKDRTLNPEKYFIVIPAMFGNGQSSSPSNTRPEKEYETFGGFPRITNWDNIRAQYELITKHLGLKEAHAVLGWSMGAGQTYQWAVQYPDFVKKIIPFCGSAKTSLHNIVFLKSLKAALELDPVYDNGHYATKGVKPENGLKAFGRIYAGWGFTQTFYRHKMFEWFGFKDLEDFLVNFWEKYFLSKDANNLLCMLDVWIHGDVSDNEMFKGDFVRALGSIKAEALVIPGKYDLYFPPEDSEIEVKNMKNAKLLEFDSHYGHWAGGPPLGEKHKDVDWLDARLREFL